MYVLKIIYEFVRPLVELVVKIKGSLVINAIVFSFLLYLMRTDIYDRSWADEIAGIIIILFALNFVNCIPLIVDSGRTITGHIFFSFIDRWKKSKETVDLKEGQHELKEE